MEKHQQIQIVFIWRNHEQIIRNFLKLDYGPSIQISFKVAVIFSLEGKMNDTIKFDCCSAGFLKLVDRGQRRPCLHMTFNLLLSRRKRSLRTLSWCRHQKRIGQSRLASLSGFPDTSITVNTVRTPSRTWFNATLAAFRTFVTAANERGKWSSRTGSVGAAVMATDWWRQMNSWRFDLHLQNHRRTSRTLDPKCLKLMRQWCSNLMEVSTGTFDPGPSGQMSCPEDYCWWTIQKSALKIRFWWWNLTKNQQKPESP